MDDEETLERGDERVWSTVKGLFWSYRRSLLPQHTGMQEHFVRYLGSVMRAAMPKIERIEL